MDLNCSQLGTGGSLSGQPFPSPTPAGQKAPPQGRQLAPEKKGEKELPMNSYSASVYHSDVLEFTRTRRMQRSWK